MLTIWVVLLSPVWGAIIALIWFLRRRTSIGLPSRRRRDREQDVVEEKADPDVDTEDAGPEDDRPN